MLNEVTYLILMSLSDTQKELVRSVYMVGSVVYGEYDPGKSDIDVWIILRSVAPSAKPDKLAEIQSSFKHLSEHPEFVFEFSVHFEDEVLKGVPARPYMMNMAADHGLLVFGEEVLTKGSRLSGEDLLASIEADRRQTTIFVMRHGNPEQCEQMPRLVKSAACYVKTIVQVLCSQGYDVSVKGSLSKNLFDIKSLAQEGGADLAVIQTLWEKPAALEADPTLLIRTLSELEKIVLQITGNVIKDKTG